jgi:hypothetical protein
MYSVRSRSTIQTCECWFELAVMLCMCWDHAWVDGNGHFINGHLWSFSSQGCTEVGKLFLLLHINS